MHKRIKSGQHFSIGYKCLTHVYLQDKKGGCHPLSFRHGRQIACWHKVPCNCPKILKLIIIPSEVLSMTICVVNKTNCLSGGRYDFTTLLGKPHYNKVCIVSKIITAARKSLSVVCLFFLASLPDCMSVCLCTCLSTCVSVCLPVQPFIYIAYREA